MATNIPVPDPRTFLRGDSLDYRDIQQNAFDPLQMRLQPALCMAQRTANQSSNNSATTIVTFDRVVADTGPNIIDMSVDATKMIPNVAGRYKVIWGVYWITNGGTGGRKVQWVNKNGTSVLRDESRQGASGDKARLGVSGFVRMNGTTDYLQLAMFQDSGGAQDFGSYGGGTDYTFLYIRWEGNT